MADKAALDVFGVSPLVGILISSVSTQKVVLDVMRVVVPMAMPMVVLGEVNFVTVGMISMPHAQNHLKIVGLRYFLLGLQEDSGRLQFEGLLCAVRAKRLNGYRIVIVKNPGRHGVVISVETKPGWHARLKNF